MSQYSNAACLPVGGVEGRPYDGDPTAPPPLDEAPPPPRHLDGDAAEEWRRVAAAAVALGSLRACDLPALALLAETLGLARAAQRALMAEGFTISTAAGNPKGNPAGRILAEARQHAAQMLKCTTAASAAAWPRGASAWRWTVVGTAPGSASSTNKDVSDEDTPRNGRLDGTLASPRPSSAEDGDFGPGSVPAPAAYGGGPHRREGGGNKTDGARGWRSVLGGKRL